MRSIVLGAGLRWTGRKVKPKMRIQKIICDYCGEEIPTVKKKDLFGTEREFYRLGKLSFGNPFNDINPHTILGIDLCERCAGNISFKMCEARIAAINSLKIIIEKRKGR